MLARDSGMPAHALTLPSEVLVLEEQKNRPKGARRRQMNIFLEK